MCQAFPIIAPDIIQTGVLYISSLQPITYGAVLKYYDLYLVAIKGEATLQRVRITSVMVHLLQETAVLQRQDLQHDCLFI